MEERAEHKQEHKHVSKKKNFTDKCRDNPWIVSTIVLAVVVLLYMIPMGSSDISADDAGDILMNLYASQGVEGLELESVEESNGVYMASFQYQGATVPVYVTKDGKLVGSLSPVPSSEDAVPSQSAEQAQVDVVKSDKPVIDLFVMTHCPYGTQAEKGFIPFMEAFGDNIDAKIRFVHYFMHDPENDETPRQVCIREEQGDKFLTYLREFLNEGDAAAAEVAAGIDSTALAECISSGRAGVYYAEDSELSQAAGVQGSPSVVVNGVMAQVGRSAAAYLGAACDAFNTAPSECDTLELSSASPAPMWGWDAGSAQATTAQC